MNVYMTTCMCEYTHKYTFSHHGTHHDTHQIQTSSSPTPTTKHKSLQQNTHHYNKIQITLQVVWTTPTSDPTTCKWSCYVWRRGTVPIWWGVELRQGGVGEADVVIPQHRPYKGVARYFRRLQKRYMPDAARERAMRAARGQGGGEEEKGVLWEEGSRAVDEEDDRHVPVLCVNLLRCNMTKRNGMFYTHVCGGDVVFCVDVCGVCVGCFGLVCMVGSVGSMNVVADNMHLFFCMHIPLSLTTHTPFSLTHRVVVVGALCRGDQAPT